MKKEEKLLKWKLSEKPTADNILKLVGSGILTKEEGKRIILNEEKIEISDIENIKKEIDLLRELILASLKPIPQTITIIEKKVEKYPNYIPYGPYVTWSGGTSLSSDFQM